MTERIQKLRLVILGGIMALASYATVTSHAFAHAGHEEESGIDMVMTVQGVGVMAVLSIGYFIVSRLAGRREDDRTDQA